MRNLAVLEAAGLSRTDAIRQSLAAAAHRQRMESSLRREAERLRADRADRAEIAKLRDFLGDTFEDLSA